MRPWSRLTSSTSTARPGGSTGLPARRAPRSSMCSEVRGFPSPSDTREDRTSPPVAASSREAGAASSGYPRGPDTGRGHKRSTRGLSYAPAHGLRPSQAKPAPPSSMKRFLTAQLAACAIALLALPAMADENPPPPQSSSAQTEPAARSSVSTTVVVAVPVVSTGHLVPDLFLNLFALGVEVAAIHSIEERHSPARSRGAFREGRRRRTIPKAAPRRADRRTRSARATREGATS